MQSSKVIIGAEFFLFSQIGYAKESIVTSCDVISCHVMSCHGMFCNVTSCSVMSCFAISYDVVPFSLVLCYAAGSYMS